MKKKVLSLSIAAMIGGLGFMQADDACIVIVPNKDLLPEGSVYYQGVVYTIMLGGWI